MKAMFHAIRVRVVLAGTAVACLCLPALATSIIIDIKPDKIIMLADSRAEILNPTNNNVRDDKCKIVLLDGAIAFAETGNEGYTPTEPFDSVPEWHGTTEAIKASSGVPDHDMYQVALAWATQVTANFRRFYFVAPQRVRSMAQGNLLLLGFFAGHDALGNLGVYGVKIELDDTVSGPIRSEVGVLQSNGKPIPTHRVTQELLEGETDRAKQANDLWAKKSGQIAETEFEWRRLEFLIEQTGTYSDDVHGPVNAVEINAKSVIWLQSNTCRDQIN
jgi:hypothetical protein